MQHPRSMITFSLSARELDGMGVTKNLIRMSVGLEDVSIILEDLKQALR